MLLSVKTYRLRNSVTQVLLLSIVLLLLLSLSILHLFLIVFNRYSAIRLLSRKCEN